MWKNILFQAFFQIIILSFILFGWPFIFNITSSVELSNNDLNETTLKHFSILFNVFVLLQLFNVINTRKLQN